MKKDWYDLDKKYLNENELFTYNEFIKIKEFKNVYLDFFPENAFIRQIRYITDFYESRERSLNRKFVYLNEEEMDNFVEKGFNKIINNLSEIGEVVYKSIKRTKTRAGRGFRPLVSTVIFRNMNILITGASGSGTTTFGKYLSKKLGWNHIDADDYYWLPTNPPYKDKRESSLRLNLILKEIDYSKHNIISGSVMNWGKQLEDSFSLIVFLYVKTEIRLERLRKREKIELGFVDPEFIMWASEYDTGSSYGRSLEKHKIWLNERKCDIIKIEGEMRTEEQREIILKHIEV